MAQYTDNDGLSPQGRAFVISASEAKVITSTGEKALLAAAPVANIAAVTVPFASLTTAAQAHNALLAALKAAGVMVPDA